MNRCLPVALLGMVLAVPLQASDDDFDGLPEGEGRLETYQNCVACHSTAIIRQQNLSRRTWDEVLDWMVEEQGMWEMAPEVREAVLDYLAEQFGRE